MRTGSLTHLQTMARQRMRRTDRVQAGIAFATLAAALLVAFVTVMAVQRWIEAAAIARAEQADQDRRAAALEAHRVLESYRAGTIVFIADAEDCRKLQFDNFTGAFISLTPVDCAKQLRQMTVAERKAVAKNTASMRGMLDSFRK
jgi:hypothetical protein